MDNGSPTPEQLALIIPIVGIAGAFAVAMLAIIAGAVRRSIETSAREQTRREIAAYVAEGTISPEDGARLMEAGAKKSQLAQFLKGPMRDRP